MSHTIHRVPIRALNKLKLPPGAKVLTVQLKQGEPCIWIELDPNDALQIDRTFRVFGTGQELPDRREYLGTWQDGGYVWHLYEVYE